MLIISATDIIFIDRAWDYSNIYYFITISP